MDSKIIELKFTSWNFKAFFYPFAIFTGISVSAMGVYFFSDRPNYITAFNFYLSIFMILSLSSLFVCYTYYYIYKRSKVKLVVDTEKKVICFENFVILSKKHFLPLRPEKYICRENEIQKIVIYEATGELFILVTDLGKIYVTNSCKDFHLFANWVFDQLKDKISIKTFYF